MRIEKCAEHDGKKVTVYVDDDTVRSTDREAVRLLIQALEAAMDSTSLDQSRFVIKGGDGGTLPGERGGDVNVTLAGPLDAMEALKARTNGDLESESDKPPVDLYKKCVYAGEAGVPEVFVAGRWHPLADYSVSNLHDQNAVLNRSEDGGTGLGGDISTGPGGGRAGDVVSKDVAVCDEAAARDGKTRVSHGFVRDYLAKTVARGAG